MMTREELIRFGVSSGLSGLSGLSGMGTGPSFSPADIAGLELWLQADKGIFQDSAKTTPATSDGDVIGAWEDQSGNGNDALQGTTVNKPLLKLSIVNSRPVVRFDGANDDLLLSLLDAGSSFTSFFVIIPTATTPLGLFDSAPNKINTWRNFTGGNWEWWNIDPRFGLGLANTNPVLLEFITHIPINRQIIYYRNSSIVSTNNGTVPTAVNWDNAKIGSINATNFYSGDIAEIVMYSSVLSDDNRESVENYLNERYAIF